MFPFRLLRKHYVLFIIFFTSMTYFTVKTGLYGLILPSYETIEEKYEEFQRFRAPRSLRWHDDSNVNLTDNTSPCRNTQQGRHLITDERGYTCKRSAVLETRCCNSSNEASIQYSCDTCLPQAHCCAVYEYCVSCCLRPEQRPILESVFSTAKGARLKAFLTVRDHFELCLAKCRTSSSSVYQENQYINPELRFCYGPETSGSLTTTENNNVVK